jgi:hypothetical protein
LRRDVQALRRVLHHDVQNDDGCVVFHPGTQDWPLRLSRKEDFVEEFVDNSRLP